MYKYIILIFLFSCSLVKQNENKEDQIIARVGDKFLLRDEILYQESMGDSASVFSNQINDWLKKQLLLKSAYQSDELRLLIDRKVEKYRDDLLLFSTSRSHCFLSSCSDLLSSILRDSSILFLF